MTTPHASRVVLPGFSHKNAWPIPEQRSDQYLLDLEPDLLRNLIHPPSKNTTLVEQKPRTEAILSYSKKMILCGTEGKQVREAALS